MILIASFFFLSFSIQASLLLRSRLVFTRCSIHLFLRLVKEGGQRRIIAAHSSRILRHKIDNFFALRDSCRVPVSRTREPREEPREREKAGRIGRDRVTEATGIYASATSIREETASSTAGPSVNGAEIGRAFCVVELVSPSRALSIVGMNVGDLRFPSHERLSARRRGKPRKTVFQDFSKGKLRVRG